MTENPFESVHNCLVFHARDWSGDKRDAWLYGVVCGWDDESLVELATRCCWSGDAIARLKRLHARWVELSEREAVR